MKESVRSGIPVSLTQASMTPWISAVIVEPEIGTRQKDLKRLFNVSLSFTTNLFPPNYLLWRSLFLPNFCLLPSFFPSIQFIYQMHWSILLNIYQLHIKYETLWWSKGDKRLMRPLLAWRSLPSSTRIKQDIIVTNSSENFIAETALPTVSSIKWILWVFILQELSVACHCWHLILPL